MIIEQIFNKKNVFLNISIFPISLTVLPPEHTKNYMNLYTKAPKYDIRIGKQFQPVLGGGGGIFTMDKISRNPITEWRRRNLML